MTWVKTWRKGLWREHLNDQGPEKQSEGSTAYSMYQVN